jgi:hypothetical protein
MWSHWRRTGSVVELQKTDEPKLISSEEILLMRITNPLLVFEDIGIRGGLLRVTHYLAKLKIHWEMQCIWQHLATNKTENWCFFVITKSHLPNNEQGKWNFSRNTNLRYVLTFKYCQEHLKLLCEMCPSLISVELYMDETLVNALEPLSKLRYLTQVKLATCRFYANGIDKV